MNRYKTWIVLLVIAILLGLFTAYKAHTEGHWIFGGNDVLFWTLPLATYAFFALLSTGLAIIATASIVMGLQRYDPVAKRTVFMAIASLIAAFVALLIELGSPLSMISYIRSPNLTSSIWWETTLFILYLVFLLITFFSLKSGHSGKVPGFFVLLLAIAASSTMGGSIGLAESRPAFFGEFMPLYFLMTAVLSGVAAVVLFSLAYYHLSGRGLPGHLRSLFNEMGKVLGVLIAITLIIFSSRTIVKLYATSQGFEAFKQMAVTWPYYFELVLGLVVPFLLLLIPAVRNSSKGKALASLLVLVGLFTNRITILLAGQAKPIGPMAAGMPEFVSYVPTIYDWSVVAFALAVMLLLYTLGERYLKLTEA